MGFVHEAQDPVRAIETSTPEQDSHDNDLNELSNADNHVEDAQVGIGEPLPESSPTSVGTVFADASLQSPDNWSHHNPLVNATGAVRIENLLCDVAGDQTSPASFQGSQVSPASTHLTGSLYIDQTERGLSSRRHIELLHYFRVAVGWVWVSDIAICEHKSRLTHLVRCDRF